MGIKQGKENQIHKMEKLNLEFKLYNLMKYIINIKKQIVEFM
jgi:hypothetical protein